MRKRSVFLGVLPFAVASAGWCACSTSGSTLIAASPAESDVSACVSMLSQSTPTIQVPTGSGTWTSQLTVSLGSLGSGTYTIIGSGSPNSGSGSTGAGSVNSTITDNVSGSGPMISVTLSQGQTFRFSSFNIAPNSSSTTLTSPVFIVGTCNTSGCPYARFDNLIFSSAWGSGNGTQATWMIRTDNVYGVLDHNTMNSSNLLMANVHNSSWLGVGLWGDNSWSQPDSFGTTAALYFENNVFNDNGAEDCDETPGTSGGGCRIAVRYNQFKLNNTMFALYFHGTDSTQRVRGGRQAEFYSNTVSCANQSVGCPAVVNLRSGVAYVYDNTLSTSGSWFNTVVEMDEYRTYAGFPPFGWCAGQSAYDTNDGTIYAKGTITGVSTSGGLTVSDSSQNWSANQWVNSGNPYSIVDVSASGSAVSGTNPGYEINASTSNSLTASDYGSDYYNGPPSFNVGDTYEILRSSVCMDQPSRSGGAYISGTTPTPAAAMGQTLDPTYEWNDNSSNATFYGGHVAGAANTLKIIANRDFYDESLGQGAQTSPTSPFNGTTGTGHGTLANRPTTCTVQVGYWATDTNTLYLCKTANTWTAAYQPYTYPHPLDGGTVGASVPTPAAPTNLTATPN